MNTSYLTLKPWLKHRLEECTKVLQGFISQLDNIEKDLDTPPDEKLSQIKKIRAEISKVAEEIDSIKKEIKLLNKYSLN